MVRRTRSKKFLCAIIALQVWTAFIPLSQAQSLEELYKKAVKEGMVNFYGTLAQVNAEKILPVFEKRFPGVKVNQLDITDQLLPEP
jgi:hypothetical protein